MIKKEINNIIKEFKLIENASSNEMVADVYKLGKALNVLMLKYGDFCPDDILLNNQIVEIKLKFDNNVYKLHGYWSGEIINNNDSYTLKGYGIFIPINGIEKREKYIYYKNIFSNNPKYVVFDADTVTDLVTSGKIFYDGVNGYKGEFSNGLPNGIGESSYYNEFNYEGKFLNGKKHGKGKEYGVNNIYLYYKGEFYNDKHHGKCEYFYYDDEIVFVGEFVNDVVKYGELYTTTDEITVDYGFTLDKLLYKGEFIDGKPEGVKNWKKFYNEVKKNSKIKCIAKPKNKVNNKVKVVDKVKVTVIDDLTEEENFDDINENYE